MFRTRTSRTTVVLAAAMSSALLLGACSSSDGSDEAAADTSPTTMATAAPSTTAPSSQTIVDVAASNPQFSTLVAAVNAAGLADTLSGTGPFTVFAPTNDAFDKLPAGTVDSLLKPENKDKLASILTYHVVAAKVMAADVKPGAVETVNGASFTIGVEGNDVVITDGQGNKSKVVKTDVPASNGVIHVIDTVLLPPASGN
jgi:transforming growth factor-beta-induced protein